MSPCTKRLQRSTRSRAPFSGLNVSACACTAGAKIALAPKATPAAAPALVLTNLRRSNLVVIVCLLLSVGNGSGHQAPATAGVEQVRVREIGLQMDRAARRELVALAKHHRELGAVVAARDEGVGAGGLDHRHLGGDAAAVGQREVLG